MTFTVGTETYIRRELPTERVARIVLARPEARNAQSPAMLYELDRALTSAATDDSIRVIVLAADGPDFSSGHDLKAGYKLPGEPVATAMAGLSAEGAAGHYAFECEAFLGLCRRWREIPKPTIASAQGRAIAGGLMLLWPMDLIVAAENATFADPVTAFGVNGVEYFSHVWEMGPRRAKEFLFTGRPMDAQEALQIGMVSQVVALEELESATLELAEEIALRPVFGVRLAKESVNRSLDAQGQQVAFDSAMALHNLGHAHNLGLYGDIVNPEGAGMIRAGVARAAAKSQPQ
jgi:enoyl-CoA hydratase